MNWNEYILNKYNERDCDADTFGEILREYCFQEPFGCYSCFDLIEGFERIKTPPEIMEMIGGEFADPVDDVCCYVKDDVTVAWYWDGDGLLYIRKGDRAVLNSDCKKSYGWEDVPCHTEPMQPNEAMHKNSPDYYANKLENDLRLSTGNHLEIMRAAFEECQRDNSSSTTTRGEHRCLVFSNAIPKSI